MRRIILVCTALLALVATRPADAADLMPAKAVPQYGQPYVPFVPDWAGLYIVGQAGAMNGSIGACCVTAGTAGGGVGYNWQFARLVLGLEGDVDRFYMSGIPQIAWDASLRARIGYTFDRLLLYVSGGFSDGDIRPVQITPTVPGFSWDAGWTVGGGVEYWATPDLSARVDYRYTSYNKNVSFPFSQTETITLRGGLSWHFGAFGMPR